MGGCPKVNPSETPETCRGRCRYRRYRQGNCREEPSCTDQRFQDGYWWICHHHQGASRQATGWQSLHLLCRWGWTVHRQRRTSYAFTPDHCRRAYWQDWWTLVHCCNFTDGYGVNAWWPQYPAVKWLLSYSGTLHHTYIPYKCQCRRSHPASFARKEGGCKQAALPWIRQAEEYHPLTV